MTDPFDSEDFIEDDCHVHFNLPLFCKIFFYCFMYYILMGPPFSLIVLRIEGRNFAVNLGFWGCNKEHLKQYIHFLCMVGSVFPYYFYQKELRLNTIEIIMAMLVTFIKTFNKAFNIATSTVS